MHILVLSAASSAGALLVLTLLLIKTASSSRVQMVPARLKQSTALHCAATSFKARPDTCCRSTAAVACHSLLFFSLFSGTAWHSASACSHGPEPDLLPVCRSYTDLLVQQACRLMHQLSHCCTGVCTSYPCLMHSRLTTPQSDAVLFWPAKQYFCALTTTLQQQKSMDASVHDWVMQVYTESTDGSYLDVKESALVWHYKDADPDFGRWQAKVCHTLPADYICFMPCHQCSYSRKKACV